MTKPLYASASISNRTLDQGAACICGAINTVQTVTQAAHAICSAVRALLREGADNVEIDEIRSEPDGVLVRLRADIDG
jgi:hypothetical protein